MSSTVRYGRGRPVDSANGGARGRRPVSRCLAAGPASCFSYGNDVMLQNWVVLLFDPLALGLFIMMFF